MVQFSPERWQRVDELFHKALDLEDEERDSLLTTECGGDAELRGLVEALLRAHATGRSVLDGGPEVLASVLAGDAAGAPASRIGAYRVVRELGRGGMGVVYLAEREDADFRQRVALKLVRRGSDTDEVLRRFRQERRILASLEHAGIARFFDGGASADGLPYLVMEYVEGLPLLEYCDTWRLGLEARLRLFGGVCRAVQYAHQNLVVHRDIKPSNILVTADGEPKLLDFGIAKLLGDDGEAEARTRTRQRVLTPAYAAPEQIRGGAISTATDVHALGLVLYELLAGSRPYDLSGLGPLEAERLVLEQEPAPPSAAVRRLARQGAASGLAAARATTPDRLRRALEGDLDSIVLKALARQPERRYGSARELGEEVARFLDGLPVQARPDVRWYRATKFARRHWRGLGAAATLVLLLTAFSVSTAAQQRRTERARRQAEEERQTAERVAAFLQGLFAAPDPFAASAERLDTFRVGALLDRGVARARADLADEPAVRARMLRTMGASYRGLARLDDAAALLEEAVATARAHHGPSHLELAAALNELGNLQLERRRDAEAEGLHREALAIHRAALGERDRRTRSSMSNLASALQNQDRLAEADSLYDLALTLARADARPDSAHLADLLNAKGVLAYRRGDLEAAISTGREALAINRALLGPEHPRVLRDANNLAQFLDRAGRPAEAEPLFREAVDRLRATLGADHPNTAMALGNLAGVLGKLGQHEEAARLFAESVARLRVALPAAPPTANILGNYAQLMKTQRRYAEAETLYSEAIGIGRAVFGEDHIAVARFRTDLASVLCAAGKRAAGEALLREVAGTLSRTLPDGHPAMGRARQELQACGRESV